jgi:SusD family.
VTPSTFAFMATYAAQPVRRYNTAVAATNINAHETVAPEYRGLTVGGVADKRVPIATDPKRPFGQDGTTPLYLQQKYTTLDASMPIATWDEAQLIIAEAEPASAVPAINAIRTKYALPAYTGTGSADDVREERRRTLFFDGHRLGDILRYGAPYSFATGRNQKSVPYGDNTCLPLPASETNGRS